MEEDMVEDAVNEDDAVYTFTAYEIDLDYEFDAVRFFDFSRAESPIEARQAELWFDSAGSYPPSPFVVRLVSKEETVTENINVSPKSEGMERMNLYESDSDVEEDQEVSAMGMNHGEDRQEEGISSNVHIDSLQKFQNQSQNLSPGLTFYDCKMNNVNSENKIKQSMKPTFPRTSTLMKPTASQLAKQNHAFQAVYNRWHSSILGTTSKNSASTLVIENQAAKRQKLEGGLLRKVVGTVQLQQTNFVHKAPKRDGFLHGHTTYTKPRITVPRDPNLETAHRAQRARAKSSKDENVTSTVRKFKALPLNRKILEAPSLLTKRSTPHLPDFQEFYLKTSERALKHSSAVLKSAVACDKDLDNDTPNLIPDYGNREPGRPSFINNASRQDGCQSSHSFKALPLNKKLLTSKGDIGIFRNSKKEITVPMEFNFQTEKRFCGNPPIELFNKLSLASETQRAANSESKLPQSFSIPAKGSKENRWGCFQQGNQVRQNAKLKPLLGGKQQLCADEEKNEVNTVSVSSWSKSIR